MQLLKLFIYVYCMIYCYRISLLALGSILHTADKDFEIDGYIIPKGTDIFSSTRGLMYDQEV